MNPEDKYRKILDSTPGYPIMAKVMSEYFKELIDHKINLYNIAAFVYESLPGALCTDESVFQMVKNIRPDITPDEKTTLVEDWNQLFESGQLVRGYDLSHPNAPWFHVPAKGGA